MRAMTFAVVGESLIDVVVRPGAAPREYPGGSPANVALGLARLDQRVAFVTRFGRDPHGDLLARHLTDAGVELVAGHRDAAATSTSTALLAADGGADYRFRLTWDIPPTPLPAGVTCLHTGSIATFLEPGASRVRELVDASAGRLAISYDPNCRPDLQGGHADARPGVEAMVTRADVVRASAEDLVWLYPGCDPVDVARGWLPLGPGLVVVTFGADGALAVTDGGEVVRDAPSVTVVDTVGAGDAFTATLLTGLAGEGLLSDRTALRHTTEETLDRLLDRAALAAALTCTRAGADPPTPAEITAALR